MRDDDKSEIENLESEMGMAIHELNTDSEEPILHEGEFEAPFVPLRDVVLFPNMAMPLYVGRERSLLAVKAAVMANEPLIVSAQKDSEVHEPTIQDIYELGTEAIIGQVIKMDDGMNSVLAQGRRRIEILEFTQWKPYIRVRARAIPAVEEYWLEDTETVMSATLNMFERVVTLSHQIPDEVFTFATNIHEPSWLADFIGSTVAMTVQDRQVLLESNDPTERMRKVSHILAREVAVLELEQQIQTKVNEEVDRSHREHFLREQIRVIQGELGEMDVFSQELNELSDLIVQKAMPDDVRAKAEKEMARLASMPPMSPEVGVIRNYLDWILNLPWVERSDDNLDVLNAAQILDEDHYGLDKVKDRILEYIAVRQVAPDSLKTPILCFVGPPGTGKTSLGKSIANALGREFVRISLGGVRDEAEIRGHRRTYIGAMPGRFVKAMRRVGTNNPLVMLDEVDKIGQDFRGDPSSALLEVLDPEQNYAFADHFLELPFDLSQTLFVTTANSLETIPAALRDRMEVIEFSSYLEEEKLQICRNFIIPHQLEQHGLDKVDITFETKALQMLVRQYTYEAGVRNLEREVAAVCRKLARKFAEGKRFSKRITAAKLVDMLGAPRYSERGLREEDEVGIATGVAWTPAGGDTLNVEVNVMKGTGVLTLTGKLGDVMQESAKAALSYTRSQAALFNISDELFAQMDVHIHVPDGAVPKDGPSAGVALVVALVSAFTNRPIRRDIAMTGEITLRGHVLPVGGIREKALAAKRAGITRFMLPHKNEADLAEIPESLREGLEFTPVKHVSDVLNVVLYPPAPPKPKRPRRPQTPPVVPPSSRPV